MSTDLAGDFKRTRVLAIVGTGTGVGKTSVTRALRDELVVRGRRVACHKPWVSGRGPDGTWSDLVILGCDAGARFVAPLSPLAAVRAGESAADPEKVMQGVAALAGKLAEEAAPGERPWLLVEGIGGLLVPLAPGLTWRDWHVSAGWPTILVGAAGLGTINHSLLAIESLRAAGIRLLGFILSENAPEDPRTAEENAAIIQEFSGVVPLGVLRYHAALIEGFVGGVGGVRPVSDLLEAALG